MCEFDRRKGKGLKFSDICLLISLSTIFCFPFCFHHSSFHIDYLTHIIFINFMLNYCPGVWVHCEVMTGFVVVLNIFRTITSMTALYTSVQRWCLLIGLQIKCCTWKDRAYLRHMETLPVVHPFWCLFFTHSALCADRAVDGIWRKTTWGM